MYAEEDLLPLSALQHLLFCPRQCALIHVEGVWLENLYTAEGRIMHERVHTPAAERRGFVRTEFALPLRSLRLGITGKADVVEFSRSGDEGSEVPYPVEYKRGKKKPDQSDLVQLCAQALCLEEMLGGAVPEGALFYGRERRRTKVLFTGRLKQDTEDSARKLHELVSAGRTPEAEFGRKCRACSLMDSCMPRQCSGKSAVFRYLAKALEDP